MQGSRQSSHSSKNPPPSSKALKKAAKAARREKYKGKEVLILISESAYFDETLAVKAMRESVTTMADARQFLSHHVEYKGLALDISTRHSSTLPGLLELVDGVTRDAWRNNLYATMPPELVEDLMRIPTNRLGLLYAIGSFDSDADVRYAVEALTAQEMKQLVLYQFGVDPGALSHYSSVAI